ncbi:MAG: hypothetical protein KDK40_02265 [Chlamydiia bacterium]|nr:hypothetical protein [Chlamydiia bacterium]
MNRFDDELREGDIQIRDKYQFELKSRYAPIDRTQMNRYTVEFFIFVPASLQITEETYSRKEFYRDLTNFIRVKTPQVPLQALGESEPPHTLCLSVEAAIHNSDFQTFLKELKLYANVVRSSLREEIRAILAEISKANSIIFQPIDEKLDRVLQNLQSIHERLNQFKKRSLDRWGGNREQKLISYVDEFVSITIESYLTEVYAEIEKRKCPSQQLSSLRAVIENERQNRLAKTEHPKHTNNEYALYRASLLKKYVYDALFLTIEREHPARKFEAVAASAAAGFAMLFYLVALAINTSNFRQLLFDSTAFIALSVLLYILKDRMKEAIKSFSLKYLQRHFPDYKTKILTKENIQLGTLTESFAFYSPNALPDTIQSLRNTQFHTVLEDVERKESCLYLKKEIHLMPILQEIAGGYYEVNDIFRYNIGKFLNKAGDSTKRLLTFNSDKGHVECVESPKVYHLNVIVRQRHIGADGKPQIEVKKVRIILNKQGIVRLERVEDPMKESLVD